MIERTAANPQALQTAKELRNALDSRRLDRLPPLLDKLEKSLARTGPEESELARLGRLLL